MKNTLRLKIARRLVRLFLYAAVLTLRYMVGPGSAQRLLTALETIR